MNRVKYRKDDRPSQPVTGSSRSAPGKSTKIGNPASVRDYSRTPLVEPAPKRQSTKVLLMDAGERLVGRHGVDGVTLRDIALLAEQANSNVIQYHFKDKSGLIGAILEDRIQRRENLRCKRLEALKAAGKGNDPRALLAILWLPTLAFRDENGEYLFCRFVLQCMLQADFAAQYPLYERYDAFSRRTKAKEGDHKALSELMALLRTHYKKLPPEVFSRRLMALSLMFISCAVEFDNARAQGPKDAELDAEPILDMAIAAMAAPT